MTDFADHAAATTAGWTRTQLDRGAAKNPRYQTTYEKHIVGEPGGSSGQAVRAAFESNTSQAAADTGALNALNGQRKVRWGAGATGNKGSRAGATMTHDTH
jgi:hypothetical protein